MLICRIRCIRIYALGVLDQTRVACNLAKSDTQNREINKIYKNNRCLLIFIRFWQRWIDMLVLTRKVNESIQIGEDIEITVLGMNGDQIKLGINAPKHVEIHRKEIYLEIQAENNEASQTPKDLLQKLHTQLKNGSGS